MSHHALARRLVDTSLELHALSPWEVFGELQFFGVSIPGRPNPFLTRFIIGSEGPLIAIGETRPRAEPGLEMGIVFIAGRPVPRRWRSLMRAAECRRPGRPGTANEPVVLLPVAPPDGSFLPDLRPGKPQEIRIALYIVSALRSAWATNLIEPQRSDDQSADAIAGVMPAVVTGEECLPLLQLSGPPEAPEIELSEMFVVHEDSEEVGGCEEVARGVPAEHMRYHQCAPDVSLDRTGAAG